jgi:hypothetical protein
MIEKVFAFFENVIQKISGYISKKTQEARQLHQIPDEQLKQLAVQEGIGALGGMNRYEKELIRREKSKLWLDNKLKQTREGK